MASLPTATSLEMETQYMSDKDRRCHEAFKTTTYEEFKNVHPERAPGTCRWALEHPAFRQWYDSTRKDLLWISAGPGCGKSVLARSLVDNEFKSGNQYKVCYFFFKDNEVQSNLTAALCAILHQIFAFAPHLIHLAMPAWDESGEYRIREMVNDMWEVILSAAGDPQIPSLVCVLDALDECREDDRKHLIAKLTKFYDTRSPDSSSVSETTQQMHLKFIVTSRSCCDTRSGLQLPPHIPSIQLHGEDENEQTHQDIDEVIKIRVNDIATSIGLDQQMRDRLESRLLQTRNRTYLWLHLVVESIFDTVGENLSFDDESIQCLPAGIDDAYEWILSKASKKTQYLKLILHIITSAERPLTIAELAIAFGVAFKPQATGLRDAIPEKKDLENQIKYCCGPFVTIRDSRVYLIHPTAKDFLVRSPGVAFTEGTWKHCLIPAESETIMADVCIRFLLFSDIVSVAQRLVFRMTDGDYRWEPFDVILDSHDDTECFLTYSVGNWASHVRNTCLPMDVSLKTKATRLYNDQEASFALRNCIFWRSIGRRYSYRPMTSRLHLAAVNGHEEFVLDFLTTDPASINGLDNYGVAAIARASQFGHLRIVELLINKGADVNASGEHNPTALVAASIRGHTRVVELLLSKGAIIDNQALEMASSNGHLAVAELLLSQNVQANLRQHDVDSSALWDASLGGHLAVVKLLLSQGANVNSRGLWHTTPLQGAAKRGHLPVIELLLSHGAEVNPSDPDADPALPSAAEAGCLAIVELLLSKGADVNARDHEGDTALNLALREGHHPVAELLVSGGADVNARGKYDDSPLDRALMFNHQVMADLLISKGAVGS